MTEASARIRLLPRHPVFLQIGRDAMFDLMNFGTRRAPLAPGQLFAKCFRAVWGRLPLAVRKSLLAHWRRSPSRLRIELTTFRLDGLKASCADDGYTLRFRPYCDLVRESDARKTIAHELAHAFLRASGNDDPAGRSYEAEEQTVHRLAGEWGFPQTGSTAPPQEAAEWDEAVNRRPKK